MASNDVELGLHYSSRQSQQSPNNETQQDAIPQNKKGVELFMMCEKQIFFLRHEI
jgi:hypothetical protein